jgi:hypothetical protein
VTTFGGEIMENLSIRVAAALRRAGRAYLTAKAGVQGKAFYCAALAGRSGINLCVNSDLTVSCSCHDVDGSGQIGDMAHESLREVLCGPIAQRFREELARGRLPTPLCARCCDLCAVAKDRAQPFLAEYRLPTYLMVENTVACNLRCVSCPRTQVRRLRKRVSMSLDDVRRVARELSETGIRTVAYLNQGEPFLSRTIRQELEILRESNPGLTINTSTNAMLIDSDEKREAALLLDNIQVSLDGTDQATAERYQRGIDFDKAYRNMKSLVETRDARGLDRPLVIWKYLLFRWNEKKKHLRRAIEMGRAANVDTLLFEKTVSPFYAIPVRYYLGLLTGIGQQRPCGIEVLLRQSAETGTQLVCDTS